MRSTSTPRTSHSPHSTLRTGATRIGIPRGIPRPRPGPGCVRGSGSCRRTSRHDAPSAYSDIPDSDLVRATLGCPADVGAATPAPDASQPVRTYGWKDNRRAVCRRSRHHELVPSRVSTRTTRATIFGTAVAGPVPRPIPASRPRAATTGWAATGLVAPNWSDADRRPRPDERGRSRPW